MTTTRTVLASSALLGAFVLAGCGQQTAATVASDPPSTSPTPAPIPHPTGADDVVVRVDVGGGFTSAAFAFLDRPTTTITGDDRILVPVGLDDGAPLPAMLPVQQATLEEATVQEVLREARDAGLLRPPPDYAAAAPMVSDMPTTTVVITADGHTWRHEAYALGPAGQETGVRRVLARFVAELAATAAGSGTTSALEPDHLLLDAARTTGHADDVREWPADAVPLARVGDCRLVDATPELVDLLTGASGSTVFEQDGRRWSVTGAEVLPGDLGCPVGGQDGAP